MAPPQPGTPLPDVTLYEGTPLKEIKPGMDPVKEVKLRDVFAGKKGVLVNMSGAFTPCCTNSHCPSYIQNYEKFLQCGCDVVVVTAINDPFTLTAWGEQLGGLGKIRFLADTYGKMAEAFDVLVEGTNPGGKRSKRFSACIQDNVIKAFNLEADDMKPTSSMAEPTCEQFKTCCA